MQAGTPRAVLPAHIAALPPTRIPHLTLAAEVESLAWQPNPLIRGLRALPVRF